MTVKVLFPSAIIMLLFCLPFVRAHAQYNHAYAITWPTNLQLNGESLDIVEADGSHQCVLSKIENWNWSPGLIPNDFFISLKKINMTGNPVWDVTYQFTDSFYKLEPWRLIKTLDNGFLVVGRAIDKSYGAGVAALANPFAFKVDQNGGLQWANIYSSNIAPYFDSIQTTVTRVEDDTSHAEQYMITRSGSANPGYNFPGDVCINALKIDVNGTLIWNKKYQLQKRSGDDYVVLDYPNTITHVPDSTDDFYFIAGTRYNRDSRSSFRDSSLFVMGVNRDGNVVRSYRWLHVPGYPFNEDAIYDNTLNTIVMSYTHGNSGLVDPHLTSNRSQIGIMKLDRNLGVTMMKYYWSPEMKENHAVRIKRNPGDNAYIIACNVLGATGGPNNISQLKVNKAGVSAYYNRYNINRDSRVYGLYCAYDSRVFSEYYDMVGYRKSNAPFVNDFRIMATDVNGQTCGAEHLRPIDSNYHDSVRLRTYKPVDTEGYWSINLIDAAPDQAQSSCDSTTGSNFRQAPKTAGNADASEIRLHPNLLIGQSNVTIETDVNSPTEAMLMNSDGRIIASRRFEAGTKIEWNLPELAVGSYSVKISSNGKSKVFRITKL